MYKYNIISKYEIKAFISLSILSHRGIGDSFLVL